MRRGKAQSKDSREALRQVRKPLPPPSRAKADEKKYRRGAARRAVRKEIEQEAEKE
jgi:hypothetical protein